MFNLLGGELLPVKLMDDFVGVIPTKSQDYFAVLIYNYIDPAAGMNYLSSNIVNLNSAEKKAVLNIVKSETPKSDSASIVKKIPGHSFGVKKTGANKVIFPNRLAINKKSRPKTDCI